MITGDSFHNIYEFFAHKRRILYASTVAIVLLCLGLFSLAPIRADISAMIPQGKDGTLIHDLNRLSKSGLANIIFISIHADIDSNQDDLIAGATALKKSLSSVGLTFTDQTSVQPDKVIRFLLDNAPNLMTMEDLVRLKDRVSPEYIHNSLGKAVRTLNSPQGVGMKRIIRHDPLEFHSILTPRLKGFSSLSQARIMNGHVFNQDGTAILLSAKSSIPLTDADGSALLLRHFKKAKETLPPGISTDIISGHVHSDANASTIKKDLIAISIAAGAALGFLFIVFFRTRHALGVFMAPLASMSIGLGGLALFNGTISAIVIGFGSVIVGISIDFAMHVYFAVTRHSGKPGEAVDGIAKPIFFCALTSCAAFGALFLSGMPGMRQLAMFSIFGLLASVLFSFLVLPHLSRKGIRRRSFLLHNGLNNRYPTCILAISTLMVGICIWFGFSITIDPDLRSIGYVPNTVREAEADFKKTWGDVRNKALVFTQGCTQQITLSQNEHLYLALKKRFPKLSVASLAPIIPAFTTQADNRARWIKFWTESKKQELTKSLQSSSDTLGFSAKAFTPFLQKLTLIPEPVTPGDLDNASLSLLHDIFLPDAATNDPTIVTYLPDSKDIRRFFTPEQEQELGVHLVSGSRFKTILEATMKSDIISFITISGLSVILLNLVLFRNFRRTCIAILPAISGVCAVFGGLGFVGTPLNLFHITALPLVIGLGADYGIFLVCSETQPLKLDTLPAVAASGLTTLAGFGVLILARHPSLSSLGITVLLGVGTALLVALFMIPHLLRKHP